MAPLLLIYNDYGFQTTIAAQISYLVIFAFQCDNRQKTEHGKHFNFHPFYLLSGKASEPSILQDGDQVLSFEIWQPQARYEMYFCKFD